ncbi:MAG: class I tRNA ligase family protein, partial [Parcubacteria group bacterium]|nr:class I tRNA ligase family protein [Parcubacteria group bacterium]
YDTPEAVYFDVSKFSDYTKLSGQELSEKIIGARDEVEIETNKKNPHDFVLWFKCVGKYKDHILRWESPWGVGFPGWHIECSAMSMKYLDEAFDIHCGGVDHIAVHHTNEIAQSEGATGKQFVKYWLHGEFLTIDEKRMGKSEGNFLTLDDIIKKGFHPLSYRYLMLLNHYRSKMSFSFDALTAAQNALFNVYYQLAKMEDGGEVVSHYLQRFTEAVNDDLNTPQALGIAHEMLASNIVNSDKRATFEKFDEIFGLKIKETIQTINDIPDDVRAKTRERDEHRAKQQWREADALRAEIESRGYRIEDYEDRSTVVLKNIYYENFCD